MHTYNFVLHISKSCIPALSPLLRDHLSKSSTYAIFHLKYTRNSCGGVKY